MDEPTFIIGLAIAATTLVMVARTIAAAFGARKTSRELGDVKEQLDQHAAALEDAQNSLEHQAAQLAELQERLDFTERMLAQNRERSALRPGEPQ